MMGLTALKGFAQENLTQGATPILTPWKPRSGPSDKEFLMGTQPHKRETCKMKLPTEGISCPIVIDFMEKVWLSQTLESSHIYSNDLEGY